MIKCVFCNYVLPRSTFIQSTCIYHNKYEDKFFSAILFENALSYSINYLYKDIFFGFDSYSKGKGSTVINILPKDIYSDFIQIASLDEFIPLPKNEESLQKILDRYVNLVIFT